LKKHLLTGTAKRVLATADEPPADLGLEALSVAVAAARVGVSRSFLYLHIASGALPTIKLGKRRLVRIEALHLWLKSLETRAA
jgi:excisionase family DNA binding protein